MKRSANKLASVVITITLIVGICCFVFGLALNDIQFSLGALALTFLILLPLFVLLGNNTGNIYFHQETLGEKQNREWPYSSTNPSSPNYLHRRDSV